MELPNVSDAASLQPEDNSYDYSNTRSSRPWPPCCAFTARGADAPEKAGQLIAVLHSDASVFEKARACQQLGEIGNRDAVPALAALLSDPHLSAYARSGLEGIPDPTAAAALRESAAKLKGPLLAGVINSLGALRDGQAVELLSRLAADPNSGVVNESLLALGNISSPESIRILQQLLANAPDALRAQAAAACLLAADRQRAAGNGAQAVTLFDSVRTADVPTAFRVGATRGAILARNTDRVPFLLEQLRSGELAIRNAALLTIREIPDDTLPAALNAELARATTGAAGATAPGAGGLPQSRSPFLRSKPWPEVRIRSFAKRL